MASVEGACFMSRWAPLICSAGTEKATRASAAKVPVRMFLRIVNFIQCSILTPLGNHSRRLPHNTPQDDKPLRMNKTSFCPPVILVPSHSILAPFYHFSAAPVRHRAHWRGH